MINILKTKWPIGIIVLLWLIFSAPYFFKGLVPFPSTYQVTFFPPWNASYGMPVKNNAMPDVITQIYPWKKLTIDAWKQGEIPLWNPYSFSGTTHAANYQSAVFSPFNMLFFVLPMIDAWSVLILLQSLLAGLFMYFFLRTLARSPTASLLGSLAFMFCGFMVVWMAYGTLGYAALCLPLILAFIYRSLKHPTIGNLLPISLGIATSFFSGHFQISLYVAAAALFFFLYMAWKEKAWKQARVVAVFFVLGLLIALPQISLTYRAFSASTRGESITRGEIIPWQYLPTMFAPDFYGNPVTRNDWFGHYAEWATYVGVVPLLLALYVLSRKRKDHVIWFFIILAAMSLLLAYPTPVNAFLYILRVPVLATSAASRIVILFSFSLAALAAYGLDALMSAWKKKELRDTVVFASVAAGTVVVGLTIVWVAPLFPADKLAIAQRNMLLPSLFAVCSLVLFFLGTVVRKHILHVFLILVIIGITGADVLRFSTKWMPFDPRAYVFPEQKTLTFLQKTIGHHRVYGGLGGEVGVYYGIPLLEGYDAMYQRRYGELVASASTGHFTPSGRSVVMLDKHGVHSERLLQLLGVRYLVHRLSDAQNVWAYPWWQFPQYKSIYRDEHYEVFENEKALPRAYLASTYVVASDNQEILDALFADDFDGRNSVVLEVEPAELPASGSGEVVITSYTANTVTLEVRTDAPKILVLSDVFDAGWKATVDGKPIKIYRANYDFRAIAVSAGRSTVKFFYRP